MAAAEAPPGRYLSIHYLRAIAAMMVVVYHIYSHQLILAHNPALVIWLRQGVGIFFVISGFVMVSSTAARPRQATLFMWRRILRIVPLYWFATICLALGLGERNGLHLLQSLFFVPSINPETGQIAQPVLDVGWTLNYEMAFYVLFALLMTLPRRLSIWAAILTLVLLPCLQRAAIASPIATFYLDPILLDFAAGMLIAHMGLRMPAWGLLIGFAMLALMPIWYDWRPISVTLPAALILASARSLDGRLGDWAFATLLGDASYAIYLSHLFILFALHPLVSELGNDLLVFMLSLGASMAMGIIVHLFVEKPLHQRILPAGRAEALPAV